MCEPQYGRYDLSRRELQCDEEKTQRVEEITKFYARPKEKENVVVMIQRAMMTTIRASDSVYVWVGMM